MYIWRPCLANFPNPHELHKTRPQKAQEQLYNKHTPCDRLKGLVNVACYTNQPFSTTTQHIINLSSKSYLLFLSSNLGPQTSNPTTKTALQPFPPQLILHTNLESPIPKKKCPLHTNLPPNRLLPSTLTLHEHSNIARAYKSPSPSPSPKRQTIVATRRKPDMDITENCELALRHGEIESLDLPKI